MAGGLWMTDANLKSTLYLKNVVEISSVTVTPVLHLSNGNKYPLPAVTLDPAGTAVIDINAALQNLGIASYATLSGYVEIDYKWPWVPLCATIRVTDLIHSTIFTYGVPPLAIAAPKNAVQRQETIAEGIWWKHEKNVTAFVSLANTSSRPVPAEVRVLDNVGATIQTHDITISPGGNKVIDLFELQETAASEGGIEVTYSGPAGALDVVGGLQDQSIGYSANIRFIAPPKSSTPTSDDTVAELGLMTGAADPMMLFPAGTTFTPYSVLRNISDAPMTITPTVWWMQGGSAHFAALASVGLQPSESRVLDMRSMLSSAALNSFNGSLNLAFEVKGKQGGLLLQAGSVDQTGTYVFEVNPKGVAESASKSLSYWSIGNGDDTMVNIWNPADEAQDFNFRLNYSGGHYSLPLHLEPRATRNFNLSEIIQNQLPDNDGNLIPPNIHEGSATISGVHSPVEHILVALDYGIYNVRKATCTQGCNYCDGYTSFGPFSPNNAGMAVQGTQQYEALATWSNGLQYDVANSWSSSNTSVATVDSSGLATGVGAGSATITAHYGPDPVYVGELCYYGQDPGCPATESGQMSGTGYVISVSLSQNTFGPLALSDTARNNYDSDTGTYSLGAQATPTFAGCFAGLENVGAVTPSGYPGSVQLHRRLLSYCTYTNSNTQFACSSVASDDTALPSDRDDNPSGSGGDIFDFDTPGHQGGTLSGSPYRFRANFSEYATLPGGSVVSNSSYNYYARVSCKVDASGNASLDTTVSGDNQIGPGTTNTTWNLQ